MQLWVAPAQKILAAADRAKASALAAGRGEAGTVKLAYAGASTHVLVGVLAREVRRVDPGLEFRLNSQDFALPALARVLRGEVDISLGRWDFVPAGVQSRIIVEEHLVMAVPASHRLVRKGKSSWRNWPASRLRYFPRTKALSWATGCGGSAWGPGSIPTSCKGLPIRGPPWHWSEPKLDVP